MFYFLKHIELEKEEPKIQKRKEGDIDLYVSQKNYFMDEGKGFLPPKEEEA